MITPTAHHAMYGGMDVGIEPHLLPENKWRFLQNIRNDSALKQVERFVPLTPTFLTTVDALVNLPTGANDYGHWLAFARNGVFRLTLEDKVQLITLKRCSDPISTCVYNGRVYFTNQANPVRSTDAGRIYEVFNGRRCWTKPSNEELIGDGPFTGHPLYDDMMPVGDLGYLFNWTEGELYRVYLRKPHIFTRHCEIAVIDVMNGIERRDLTGRVIAVYNDYVVVKASNTEMGVKNVGRTLNEDWTYSPREARVTNMDVPSGRYVTVFFDHLVLGAPTYKGIFTPERTIWSHLKEFSMWDPHTASEADAYTHSEYERGDDIVKGVTGFAHYGEMLLIFTPSCIYAMQYVGLPRVMRVTPLIKDFGCGLPFAVAELSNSCVWCDVHHGSFFAFRGEGPENIGSPIASYFFGDVSNDTAWLRLTKAVVDRKNHEVLWLYHSKAATSQIYDKAIVYDYFNNAWSTRLIDGITALGLLNKRSLAVDDYEGVVDDDDSYINETEDSGEQLASIVATSVATTNTLLRTEITDDTIAATILSAPVLETRDLLYGSQQSIKEVSSIWLDADADIFNGVKVEISAREFVDDDVEYVNVGIWTKSLQERILTFAPQVGRILRYRFTPIPPVSGFVLRGFEDNVVNVGSSR